MIRRTGTLSFISLLIIALMSATVQINAETVSQKQAKKIAEQFFNAASGTKLAPPQYVYNGRRLTTNRLFPPFYVYNHPTGGFVIISAENKTFPILGYNLTEEFDADNIDESMLAILELYAKHIEYIRYDSQIPYLAIEEWQNIPQHISNTLSADYNVAGQYISREMAQNAVESTINDNNAGSISNIYTPLQWSELIDAELGTSRNVALGIISGSDVFPIVAYGKKGNLYRFSVGENNRTWLRLMPSEIISTGYVASFGNPPIIENEPYEEPPFEFYDNFMAEIKTEQAAQQTAIENAGVVVEPIIRHLGGGHYMLTLPEEITSVRVYSLSGSLILHSSFRNTNTAAINIEAAGNGFYFAVAKGNTGKLYGMKLFR